MKVPHMETKVRYELMTPGEIVAARERCPVAYLPLGPMEWHGPHLPLGTDALVAHHLALRVAGIVGGLVLPALFAGTDALRPPEEGAQGLRALGFQGHERILGMDFPGFPVKSLYFEESVLGITVREFVRRLKAEPFRLIVLVNFHGAGNHGRTLQRIALEESDEPRVRVILPALGGRPRRSGVDPGHAEKWETEIVMALEEPNVRLEALPPLDQPLPYPQYGIVEGRAFAGNPPPDFILTRNADPRFADRDEGIVLVEEVVAHIAQIVNDNLKEVLATHPS
jgi:creatinine amidohydrolase